jgi:hypothetical protein
MWFEISAEDSNKRNYLDRYERGNAPNASPEFVPVLHFGDFVFPSQRFGLDEQAITI